jgi:demethylmenaquinone methyltransferase/2-methoxy-6-polyprenyl-1,4-benzoquinol methylase
MPRPDHFGLLAPIYERFFSAPPPDGLRRALKLPTSGLLLDAGGGTGRVTAQFAGEAQQVVIADLSQGMLRQAVSRHGLQTVLAPAERLPFADGTIMRIVMVDALHHVYDAASTVRELVRVLAPGGRMVIQEPDWRIPSVRLISWAEKLALMRSHPHLPGEIVAMARQAGARARCWAPGDHSVWIIAAKPPPGAP